ncbi:hypothetical protein [Streptomyces sp. NPDC007172]|uniref:hypothetical protein n=1 Tax=Streptomyces sp. NPDC007172 TaxID=3364776 RepID=UPI0036AD51C9
MGQNSPQPRQSSPLDVLREIAPGAEVVHVRANPHDWSQGELVGAYTWPQHQGEGLVSLSHGNGPGGLHHIALTVGEFLSRYRDLPVVGMLYASETSYTYHVELAPPSWSLAGGDSQ